MEARPPGAWQLVLVALRRTAGAFKLLRRKNAGIRDDKSRSNLPGVQRVMRKYVDSPSGNDTPCGQYHERAGRRNHRGVEASRRKLSV